MTNGAEAARRSGEQRRVDVASILAAGILRPPPTIKNRPITGLQGLGLIQFGETSRLELRDRLQMKRAMFGRVVNVSERTIAKVESSATLVDKLQRPYNEIFRLFVALSEVVDSDSPGKWFATPNDAFSGLKPVEVVERGEIDLLWEMVFRLRKSCRCSSQFGRLSANFIDCQRRHRSRSIQFSCE